MVVVDRFSLFYDPKSTQPTFANYQNPNLHPHMTRCRQRPETAMPNNVDVLFVGPLIPYPRTN